MTIEINQAGASPQTLASVTRSTEEVQIAAIGDDLPGEGVGASTDAEATGDGSLIAIVKRLRTLLSRGFATTAGAPAEDDVTTTSALSVPSNASRKGMVIVNVSAAGQRVSLALGATAVLDRGITLYPRGTWVMDETTYTTAQINGIASATGAQISIQEWT